MGDISTTAYSISTARASFARQLVPDADNKSRLREQVRALRISILFNLRRRGEESRVTALKLCSSLLKLVKDNQIMSEAHFDYSHLSSLTQSYHDCLKKQYVKARADTPEWFVSLRQVEHNYYDKSIVVALRSIGNCLSRVFNN